MNRIIITAAPRQYTGKKEGTPAFAYEPVDNERLAYDQSFSFPAMNIIKGYVEAGDDVKLLVITAAYPACEENYMLLKEQATELCEQIGAASIAVEKISVEFSEKSENHLQIFKSLIRHIHDDCRLSACITFGSKPTPLLEIMALNYGYRTCKNVAIDCIAYGEVDHDTYKKRIYDVTSLFLMDQIVNELGQSNHHNVLKVIESLLSDEQE